MASPQNHDDRTAQTGKIAELRGALGNLTRDATSFESAYITIDQERLALKFELASIKTETELIADRMLSLVGEKPGEFEETAHPEGFSEDVEKFDSKAFFENLHQTLQRAEEILDSTAPTAEICRNFSPVLQSLEESIGDLRILLIGAIHEKEALGREIPDAEARRDTLKATYDQWTLNQHDIKDPFGRNGREKPEL